MDIKQSLTLLADGRNLSLEDMQTVMRQIMSGGATDAQIGAFLMALRLKGETLDEITGAVLVMRELVTAVPVAGEYLVDIVGTGGDSANLFNVSTASAFVVAAGGGRVAKHGNRSVSSSSGSADVLEAAGIRLGLEPEQLVACIERTGVGFMFAPAHHGAMRHAIGPRREMGMRTIFNILGPMTNPARVKRLLIGVYERSLCRPIAEVLDRLGAEHVMVVHSDDGLDEISSAAPTHIAEAQQGELSEYQIEPAEFGIQGATLDGLEVTGAVDSLSLIRDALSGAGGERAEQARQIVALNAGAALYVAGLQSSIRDGVAEARVLLESGRPWKRVEALAAFSQSI